MTNSRDSRSRGTDEGEATNAKTGSRPESRAEESDHKEADHAKANGKKNFVEAKEIIFAALSAVPGNTGKWNIDPSAALASKFPLPVSAP